MHFLFPKYPVWEVIPCDMDSLGNFPLPPVVRASVACAPGLVGVSLAYLAGHIQVTSLYSQCLHPILSMLLYAGGLTCS
jgi:hypothetical protein